MMGKRWDDREAGRELQFGHLHGNIGSTPGIDFFKAQSFIQRQVEFKFKRKKISHSTYATRTTPNQILLACTENKRCHLR